MLGIHCCDTDRAQRGIVHTLSFLDMVMLQLKVVVYQFTEISDIWVPTTTGGYRK